MRVFKSLQDVLLINKIRFWLNSVMDAPSYSRHHHAAPSKERMREVSQKTLGFLFELITKPRKDAEFVPSTSYKWNLVKSEHVEQLDDEESQLDTLIPLHNCIKLSL